jgi:hypothetical protein
MFGFKKSEMAPSDGESEIVEQEAQAQSNDESRTDVSAGAYAEMTPEQRAARWPQKSIEDPDETAEAA